MHIDLHIEMAVECIKLPPLEDANLLGCINCPLQPFWCIGMVASGVKIFYQSTDEMVKTKTERAKKLTATATQHALGCDDACKRMAAILQIAPPKC